MPAGPWRLHGSAPAPRASAGGGRRLRPRGAPGRQGRLQPPKRSRRSQCCTSRSQPRLGKPRLTERARHSPCNARGRPGALPCAVRSGSVCSTAAPGEQGRGSVFRGAARPRLRVPGLRRARGFIDSRAPLQKHGAHLEGIPTSPASPAAACLANEPPCGFRTFFPRQKKEKDVHPSKL